MNLSRPKAFVTFSPTVVASDSGPADDALFVLHRSRRIAELQLP
jgi:hypothetical protein